MAYAEDKVGILIIDWHIPHNKFLQARRIKVQSIVDTSGEPDVRILGQAILIERG